MAANVVQFRTDEHDLEELRRRGINPNEFGHRAFEAALRRLRAEDRLAQLARAKVRLPRDVAALVREARDEH